MRMGRVHRSVSVNDELLSSSCRGAPDSVGRAAIQSAAKLFL